MMAARSIRPSLSHLSHLRCHRLTVHWQQCSTHSNSRRDAVRAKGSSRGLLIPAVASATDAAATADRAKARTTGQRRRPWRVAASRRGQRQRLYPSPSRLYPSQIYPCVGGHCPPRPVGVSVSARLLIPPRMLRQFAWGLGPGLLRSFRVRSPLAPARASRRAARPDCRSGGAGRSESSESRPGLGRLTHWQPGQLRVRQNRSGRDSDA